jgi:phage portal protein BeeE
MFPQEIESKGYPDGGCSGPGDFGFTSYESLVGFGFADYLYQGGNYDLAAYQAIKIYSNCFPLGGAIDLRASGFSDIIPRVYDKQSERFINDHAVLELLENPNPFTSSKDFKIRMASYLDITGNSFLRAHALDSTRQPTEIYSVPPQQLSITPSTRSDSVGQAGIYHVSDPYTPQEKFVLPSGLIGRGRARYFNDNGMRELWQIKSFNPYGDGNHLFGISPARVIFSEINQYIQANSANLSALKNDMNPSGILHSISKDKGLTTTQWERMKEVASEYTKSVNNRRVLTGDGFTFTPIRMNNRDMEFRDLLRDLYMRVQLRYGIPLALTNPESMTYNNQATARYSLYHDSIIPLANRLYSELTAFLMPRYGRNSRNLIITFNRREIPELRLAFLEEGRTLKDIGVNTPNEIRRSLGDQEIDDPQANEMIVTPQRNMQNQTTSE